MYILFFIIPILAVFFAIFFTRRHGSKAIFKSIGHLILLIGTPILLVGFLPYYVIGLPKIFDDGLLLIYLGGFSLFIVLPGYIVLATLIYFFWPTRFEPILSGTLEDIQKLKRQAQIMFFFAFIIFPILTLFVLSRTDSPDKLVCIFDSTGECDKDKQLFIDNQRIGGLR